MNKTLLRNLTGLILLVAAIIFTVILLFSVKDPEFEQITKDGVYVVGQASDIKSNTKSSSIFVFNYKYKGMEYKFHIGDVGSRYAKGDLIFIKISASRPEFSTHSEFSFPPPGPCITYESSPPEGWKEIPACK